MGSSLPNDERMRRLNSVERPKAIDVKPSLNDVETAARLIRKAIGRTGMSHDEIAAALGVKDKGQATRLIEGVHKERLWLHLLLRKQAYPILRELFTAVMLENGEAEVERIVRIKERSA